MKITSILQSNEYLRAKTQEEAVAVLEELVRYVESALAMNAEGGCSAADVTGMLWERGFDPVQR